MNIKERRKASECFFETKMKKIDYSNRRFVSVSNSESGEVSAKTIFHYHQKDNFIWATYEGGSIIFGTLIAKVLEDDSLEMRYQHLNQQGNLMTGECKSVPEILDDGRVRLYETWQWTCGDFSKGKSVVEELKTASE